MKALQAMRLLTQGRIGDNKLKDARAALVSLGYTPNEISASLRGVDTASLSVSDIVRAALKKMSQ